jgi:ADP-ribose pyrophosphatase
MEKWRILESSYVYKSPFGNLRKDICLLPNLKIIDDFYVNEYPDWVDIIAITKEGNIVLTKQYRHGVKDFTLEVPGGIIDSENESAEQAAIRELKEETGYISDNLPIFLGDMHTNTSNATNKEKSFLMLNAYKKFEQQTDDTEEIEVVLIPFNKVGQLIKNNNITQIFSVTSYYLAKEYMQDIEK